MPNKNTLTQKLKEEFAKEGQKPLQYSFLKEAWYKKAELISKVNDDEIVSFPCIFVTLAFCHSLLASKTNMQPLYSSIHSNLMGESSKFPKSWTFETPILKLAVCPLNILNFNFNGQLFLDRLYINRKTYYNLPNSGFWGWFSMESQPQNPDFRNNPENFHPWISHCEPAPIKL